MEEDILLCSWRKDYEPHPSTLPREAAAAAVVDGFVPVGPVCQLSETHAYCKPCRFHMVTRPDPQNYASYFESHLNDADHKAKSAVYPRSLPLFDFDRCHACQIKLEPFIKWRQMSIEAVVNQHVSTAQHRYNSFHFLDKKSARLIAISLHPVFQRFVEKGASLKSWCRLCDKKVWEEPEVHMKIHSHLQYLRKRLLADYGFEIADFLDDEKTCDLVRRIREEPIQALTEAPLQEVLKTTPETPKKGRVKSGQVTENGGCSNGKKSKAGMDKLPNISHARPEVSTVAHSTLGESTANMLSCLENAVASSEIEEPNQELAYVDITYKPNMVFRAEVFENQFRFLDDEKFILAGSAADTALCVSCLIQFDHSVSLVAHLASRLHRDSSLLFNPNSGLKTEAAEEVPSVLEIPTRRGNVFRAVLEDNQLVYLDSGDSFDLVKGVDADQTFCLQCDVLVNQQPANTHLAAREHLQMKLNYDLSFKSNLMKISAEPQVVMAIGSTPETCGWCHKKSNNVHSRSMAHLVKVLDVIISSGCTFSDVVNNSIDKICASVNAKQLEIKKISTDLNEIDQSKEIESEVHQLKEIDLEVDQLKEAGTEIDQPNEIDLEVDQPKDIDFEVDLPKEIDDVHDVDRFTDIDLKVDQLKEIGLEVDQPKEIDLGVDKPNKIDLNEVALPKKVDMNSMESDSVHSNIAKNGTDSDQEQANGLADGQSNFSTDSKKEASEITIKSEQSSQATSSEIPENMSSGDGIEGEEVAALSDSIHVSDMNSTNERTVNTITNLLMLRHCNEINFKPRMKNGQLAIRANILRGKNTREIFCFACDEVISEPRATQKHFDKTVKVHVNEMRSSNATTIFMLRRSQKNGFEPEILLRDDIVRGINPDEYYCCTCEVSFHHSHANGEDCDEIILTHYMTDSHMKHRRALACFESQNTVTTEKKTVVAEATGKKNVVVVATEEKAAVAVIKDKNETVTVQKAKGEMKPVVEPPLNSYKNVDSSIIYIDRHNNIQEGVIEFEGYCELCETLITIPDSEKNSKCSKVYFKRAVWLHTQLLTHLTKKVIIDNNFTTFWKQFLLKKNTVMATSTTGKYGSKQCRVCCVSGGSTHNASQNHAIQVLLFAVRTLAIPLYKINSNDEGRRELLLRINKHFNAVNFINALQFGSPSEFVKWQRLVSQNQSVDIVEKKKKYSRYRREIQFHRGVRVIPSKDFIKIFLCEMCDETDSIDELPTHLDECLPKPLILPDVRTDMCEACRLFVVSRGHARHPLTEIHRAGLLEDEQRLEVKRESKSREQALGFHKVKILKISGLPTGVEDLFSKINAKFSPFGEISGIKLLESSGTASIRFWLQASLQKALDSQPIVLNQATLCLKEETLDVFEDSTINVALADSTVHYLQDGSLLEEHCWEIAKQATSLLNSREERLREDRLLADLEAVLNRCQRSMRVWPFGSRITGLTLNNNTDIDVFAGTDEMFCGQRYQTESDQRFFVHSVSEQLSKCEAKFDKISVVARARVPIIIFNHVPTMLQCDLSFRNGLSVRNTRFISLMLSLDKRVRPMVIYLKEWIVQNEFKFILTSYAVTIMLFVYLAQLPKPVLPTLSSMRSRQRIPETINGWNVSFLEDIKWKSSNKETCAQLLKGFFRYFSTFDFDEFILYPVEAVQLHRSLILDEKRHRMLPDEIQKQFRRIKPEDYSPNINICVMDPFDLSHNLTKRIRGHAFRALTILFHLSYLLLSKDQNNVTPSNIS